jgi:hypothetical protein
MVTATTGAMVTVAITVAAIPAGDTTAVMGGITATGDGIDFSTRAEAG